MSPTPSAFNTSPRNHGQATPMADELTLREASATKGQAHVEWLPADDGAAAATPMPRFSASPAATATAAGIMRRTVDELKALK